MADASNSGNTQSAGDGLSGALSFGAFKKGVMSGDVLLAFGIICIISGLIFPLPTWLLDIALALSITVSVLILMTTLFIERPIDFTTFPTVLLIATMLRLALNVASTRLILSDGHQGIEAAGQVIEAFGGFIMQDNFVIGLIVFGILVIINFVVITKGSGRIAEVAARFSLDAMPGKQMAIDADLSSGLIDETEARKRRSELEQESNFFGSMDGAAKFVRGDAIAGLMITFINIVGGIIIGTVQQDMALKDAAHNYTTLTVGDGLVSQVPALLVSIAAGLLVSKSGVKGSADKALFQQFSQYPKGLALTAGVMVMMPLMGLPLLPFWTMAAGAGVLSYVLSKQVRITAAKVQQDAKVAAKPKVAEEPIGKTLALDIVRLELGYGLLSLVNAEVGPKLTDQVKGLRRQMAEDMGFILPSVRIQDNLQLPANEYAVRIKEMEAGRGSVRPGLFMCMDPTGQPISLPGEATIEPTFGLPAMWIEPSLREEAAFRGYTVVDAATVITTHLTEVVKDNMPELLSYTETQKLLDELGQTFQKLVADVVPAQVTITGLQRVLQNLLAERVSIRDLPTILEGISEASVYTKNIAMLTEHVRTRLARQICNDHMNDANILPLVTLAPDWEQIFTDSLLGDGEEKQLAIAPSQLQGFISRVRDVFEEFGSRGENPVLLTSPTVRPYVRQVIERFRPQTSVMSQNEIHPKIRIKTVGQV